MKSDINEGKTVGVLWLHGGGYVLGAPEMALITFPKHLLKSCNCVIVSPDYTLSAEAPYPAAFNDAVDAFEWMFENKEELGIGYDKIVIGGESAGGGLTAALTLYLRDTGCKSVAFQMPLYPMLDDRVTETSYNNDAPVWGTDENKSAWRVYIGDRFMNNYVPVYAAPGERQILPIFRR